MIIADQGVADQDVPIGGTHFTEAIMEKFKLSASKAEKLKMETSTSKYAKNIMGAMRPVFIDLLQELQRSLDYFRSTQSRAQRHDWGQSHSRSPDFESSSVSSFRPRSASGRVPSDFSAWPRAATFASTMSAWRPPMDWPCRASATHRHQLGSDDGSPRAALASEDLMVHRSCGISAHRGRFLRASDSRSAGT